MPARKKHFVKIEKVTPPNTDFPEPSKKTILLNNIIGGIGWGLGATIGVSLLLAVIGYILSFAHIIPFVGSFVAQIAQYVNQHPPR